MRWGNLGLLAAALAMALPPSLSPAHGQDATLRSSEATSLRSTSQITVHRMAAAHYEVHGLVEEAVAEYIRILALSPQDGQARARVEALVQQQMPMWLPEEVEKAAPFRCEVLRWEAPARDTTGAGDKLLPYGDGAAQRFLVTEVDFAAREGERWDQLHESGFPHIDYGYAWQQTKRRYEARVVVHWEEASQARLGQKALRAALVFWALAREQLGFDPTRPWGDPVDLWITNRGEPGARAQGRSIYLYAARTERTPGEWLREIAHEYGHVSFPGLDGFTATSDPWADGELAELLFAKWLGSFGAEASEATKATKAAGAPEWLPWNPAEWEAEAKAERERVMGLWTEDAVKGMIGNTSIPLPPVLSGSDTRARDSLLGLALRVEEMKGPRVLAELLKKCARGRAEQFVGALRRERD